MSSKFTKTEMIYSIAKLGYSKSEAERIVDKFTDTIAENLCEGRTVALTGVGVLSPTVSEPRVMQVGGSNKKVPSTIQVRFRISEKLKALFKTNYSKEVEAVNMLKEFTGR